MSKDYSDAKGLSPRVRGKLAAAGMAAAADGSIPACAGETSVWREILPGSEVYPRVCGGNGWQRRILRNR